MIRLNQQNFLHSSNVQRSALYTNIVLETFKSVNKINPPFMQDLFEVKENKYNLRGGILLDQPKVCTERYGIHTIKYQGAQLWNSLPPHMKTSVTVKDFKYHLAKWSGPVCKYGCCLSCKLPQICYLDHWAIGYNVCFYEYFEAHWFGFYKSGN